MTTLNNLRRISLVTMMVFFGTTYWLSEQYWYEVHHMGSQSVLESLVLSNRVILQLNGSSPLPPIYWIHSQASVKHKHLMESTFSQIQTHQPNATAIRMDVCSDAKIRNMQSQGQLRLENGVALMGKWFLGGSFLLNHASNRYVYHEAARLVSHLDAILTAYEAGHETALILEDGAQLTTAFVKYWRDYASLAPADWTVLQLTMDQPTIVRQMANLTRSDPWISWQPDHGSTRAYLINRAGMRRVLNETHSPGGEYGHDVWTLRGPPMLLADEVLFYKAGSAYTSTYTPFIDSFELAALIESQNGVQSATRQRHTLFPSMGFPKSPTMTLPSRNESILVLLNMRLKDTIKAQDELEQLRMDALSICSLHKVCDWHVNIVFTKQELQEDPGIMSAMMGFPDYLHLHVSVSDKGFNKFAFVAQFVDRLKDYDLFLFKDDDQRTTGFPWNSFVEAKGEAVIAGPLRQAVDESLLTNARQNQRQDYKFHEAMEWKREKGLAPWNSLFQSVTPTRTPLLEMYFVLMDGDFASWFFSRILIPEFVDQRNNWGPDLMWCGAAEEFRPGRPGCHLVPLVSKHEDRRQIDKSKEANGASWEDLGHATLSMFRRKDADFARWLSHSEPWQDAIAGWSLPWVQTKCRGFLLTPGNFSLDKCIDRLVAWEEIKLAPMHWIRSLQADAR